MTAETLLFLVLSMTSVLLIVVGITATTTTVYAEPGKNDKCTSLRTEGSDTAGWFCTTDKESAEFFKDSCNEQRKNKPNTLVTKCSSSQTAYGQQDNFKSKDV
jgi:hypothetical protein